MGFTQITGKKYSLFFILRGRSKGYTLMEILIVIGLISILAGISVVSYRSTINTVTLRQFRDQASLFLTSFESCMASSSWEVDHPSAGMTYPCSTKDKMGYVCPPDASKCNDIKDSANDSTVDHICLDLGQKIKGKNYQVYIIVNIENTAKNKLVCKEFGTGAHADLLPANCKLDSSGNLIGVNAADNKCDSESDDW